MSEARRFYLNLKPAKGASLAVVSGGYEVCSPEYAIHRPGFPYYSIEFVVRGRGNATLSGQSHALRPGRVFAYGPGIRHDILTDAKEPLAKYFVDFSGTEAKDVLGCSGLSPGEVTQVFPQDEVQVLFDELIRSGLRAASPSGDICAALLRSIAFRIAECRAPEDGTETLAFETYRECLHHIQTHYARLRQLQELAQECRLAPAYLCRLFRRYNNNHQTPYQLLRRLKMNRAAELLQARGAMVKQVAEQVGFDDPFQFSRAFKQVFGISPDAFRHMR